MKQNKKTIILGITGGVGAGKSMVLSILKEQYQAYIIEADKVGHRLREIGGPIYTWMVQEYGSEILKEDGSIDPVRVSRIAFSDKEKALKLNAYTHPVIKQAVLEEIKAEQIRAEETKGDCCVIVIEAALLSEGGLSTLCDEVWYIHTSKEIRIKRLMEHRGYTEERCKEIIGRQKSEAAFKEECDFVIENSGSRLELEKNLKTAGVQRIRSICEKKVTFSEKKQEEWRNV